MTSTSRSLSPLSPLPRAANVSDRDLRTLTTRDNEFKARLPVIIFFLQVVQTEKVVIDIDIQSIRNDQFSLEGPKFHIPAFRPEIPYSLGLSC